MKIFHDVTPAGDENFRLTGYLQLPASAEPADPGSNGFAFFVTDPTGRNILIRRELPPGADRWKQSINKRLWQYSDPTGSVGGVTKASVISIPLKGPNFYRITVTAPKGNFLLSPSNLPVDVAIVMGGPAQAIDGLCATVQFNPQTGPRPFCKNIGSSLTCR
jgi:hypothetical protein